MAVKTYKDLVLLIGKGFHPDNDMSEYVELNGDQTFTEEECITYNKILNDEWVKHGTSIYAKSMEILTWRTWHITCTKTNRKDRI